MRLVQLDDRHVVDADRVDGLVEQHYSNPEPITKVDVYLRGRPHPLRVYGTLAEVMAKLAPVDIPTGPPKWQGPDFIK